MPVWIIHTPALTTLSRIRRSVTSTKARQNKASMTEKGHHENHCISVFSNRRNSSPNQSAIAPCRRGGAADPIEL